MAWMGGVDPLPWRSEETYYVIVGCGVTAAVNFTTLLATNRTRLANLPVLFVGDDEPWSQYVQMPMGQWPAVLAPPSFRDRLRSVPQQGFLPAPDFATAIDRQWQHLAARHPFAALRGRVRRIVQSVGQFDVELEDGHSIRAMRVDVCGGPGPARRLCDHQVDPLLRPYPSVAPGAAGWRLLETGESFLNRGTVVAAGQRVAVYGGGPTAAWCVERALASGCDVTWIGDAELNPAFVSSLRNDSLAQGPLVRHRRYHTSVVRQPVFPASPRVRFAEGYVIDRVAPSPGAAVELSFAPAPGATTRYVDSRHVPLGALVPLGCDQAVIAIGQETNRQQKCPAAFCPLPRETASWATMLEPLLAPAFRAFQHFILDPADGLPAGLQTIDGALRVLGAAFLAHPVTQRQFRYKRSVMFRYLVSLCEQAQVDRGAAMTAYTTARANAWFRRRGNRNRHSATLGELHALLHLNRDHARRWHAVRSYRVDPFTTGELAALTRSTRDR